VISEQLRVLFLGHLLGQVEKHTLGRLEEAKDFVEEHHARLSLQSRCHYGLNGKYRDSLSRYAATPAIGVALPCRSVAV
jgi:hypothetical protein